MMDSALLRLLNAAAPVATVIGCVTLAATDSLASVLTPGYDFVGETSSQLMNPEARYSTLTRVSLALYAVLMVPFATRFSIEAVSPPKHVGPAPGLLAIGGVWVHIVAAIVAAAASNDSNSSVVGSVTANEVHDMAARVMFGAWLAVLIGASLARNSDSFLSRKLTITLTALATTGAAVFAFEVVTEINGLLERVIATLLVLWMIAIAVNWWRRDAEHQAGSTTRP